MSYANGTSHYNLPQTVGSDKRDWFDTNEAFASVDAALYTAYTTADSTASNVSALTDRVETNESDIADIKLYDTNNTARVDGISDSVLANAAAITDVRQDLQDSICAYTEASATSTHAYAVGDYFWYNDVLYRATANIAVGATIVPDTNCTTTNVTTEIKGAILGEVTGDGVKTTATLLNELFNQVDGNITDNCYLEFNGVLHRLQSIASMSFTLPVATATALTVYSITLGNGTSKRIHNYVNSEGFHTVDDSATVIAAGAKIYIKK